MMHTNVKCGYALVDGVTMVELPYKGGELAMDVVLPKRSESLADLEKKLTPELVAKWFGQLTDRGALEVSIPKFKLETRYELPEHLRALGMKAAFGGADFTGMATVSPGSISEVSHKAYVDVYEEGTEAAAATAVVISDSKFPPAFYANHPFLFFIRDVKHGTILFMGRVERP
jgi:serpin B